MTRVVVDTNVLISALLTEKGAEAELLDLIVAGKLVWCVSEPVLTEYEETLSRRKFLRIERSVVSAALRLAKAGEMASIGFTLAHSPHESDNRFYECAHAGQADYLVTGNFRHFEKNLPPTKIVNARQLLDPTEEVIASLHPRTEPPRASTPAPIRRPLLQSSPPSAISTLRASCRPSIRSKPSSPRSMRCSLGFGNGLRRRGRFRNAPTGAACRRRLDSIHLL